MPKQNKIVGWIGKEDYERIIGNFDSWSNFSLKKEEFDDIPIIILRKADYDALIEEAAMAIAAIHCGNCPYSDKCDTNGKTKKQHGSIQQCTTQWKRHLRSITATPKAREKKQ